MAFAAVDEGLLELRPNDSWELLDAMMDERPSRLDLDRADAGGRQASLRPQGVPAGGGGGRASARELFDTLLLWRARVPLERAGQATVEMPLNDSLTSFRHRRGRDAGDAALRTGQATIRTTQELMLLSGLPPLVREGDRYAATFTLRNASKRRRPCAPLQSRLESGARADSRPLPRAAEKWLRPSLKALTVGSPRVARATWPGR